MSQAPLQIAVPLATPGHAVEQSMQCAGSFVVSTQAPPQLVVSSGHLLEHLPSEQTSSEPQALSQPPQLAGSLPVLTQAEPHSAKPWSQLAPHLPASQMAMPFAGASHGECVSLAQSPQFTGSVFTSTHEEPQSLKPSLQATPHALFVQVAVPFSGVGQAMPQPLQLSGLLVRSMHEPLQLVRPPEQPAAHLPLSQTCAASQLVLQSPQRAGSFETSTHVSEPQSAKPGEHSTPHTPSVQVATPPAGTGQACAQAPQFLRSVAVSRHVVPHGVKSFSQANEHSASRHTALACGGAPQVVPQERQLLASSLRTTQSPPHTVWPSPHAIGFVPPLPSPPWLLSAVPSGTQRPVLISHS